MQLEACWMAGRGSACPLALVCLHLSGASGILEQILVRGDAEEKTKQESVSGQTMRKLC